MKRAIVINDRIAEFPAADAVFHSDIEVVRVSSAAAVGWVRQGSGDFAAPADLEPPLVDRLIAYALDKRWRVETGGTTVAGVPVATNDRAKLMIMGSRVAAEADPEWATVWSGADGQSYPLNSAAMIAISNAVEAHVNGAFAAFAIVKSDIEAGKIKSPADVDAARWPGHE